MAAHKKNENLKLLFWTTLMGIGITFLICTECFISIDAFIERWKTVALCMLYTYILTYGNSFLIDKLSNVYSWLEQPRKKFLLYFFSLAGFSFLVSAFLFYIFAYLMFEGSKWLTFAEVLNQAKLPAFISVSIGAFFTGASFLRNWRSEVIKSERLEKEKMITQYQSLRNQVNPHFLFNSLNALSELVFEDQELAVKYIRQLAGVYRYVLDSSDKEVASVAEEISFVESFTFLQKIRFGQNLTICIEVEKRKDLFILPLSLQILLENAIKHNVISEDEPLNINILEREGYIIVKNPKNLKMGNREGMGIGLKNIEMRYEYLTDKPVIVKDTPETFEVHIPTVLLKK